MHSIRKVMIGGALAGCTLLGGAVGATLIGPANAQTSSSTTAQAPAAASAPKTPDWSKGGHQANGITEAVVTGDDAAKITAAAEAAVPGATAQRVETDAEGAAYEVHMTKSDGSVVTVKLDNLFNVTSTIDGMG